MHTTYTLPPQFFYPRVAVIRGATGKYLVIENQPARDETELPDLHVTHIATPGSTVSMAALPADHSFIENGAASRLSWDVSAPSFVPLPGPENKACYVERAADEITRNALRVYGWRR